MPCPSQDLDVSSQQSCSMLNCTLWHFHEMRMTCFTDMRLHISISNVSTLKTIITRFFGFLKYPNLVILNILWLDILYFLKTIPKLKNKFLKNVKYLLNTQGKKWIRYFSSINNKSWRIKLKFWTRNCSIQRFMKISLKFFGSLIIYSFSFQRSFSKTKLYLK